MDHLDFIFLFISFSAWVAAFISSRLAKHTKTGAVAYEYLLFSTPFAIFTLLELMFYYLDNAYSPEYPKWVSIIYWNLVQLLFALGAYRSLHLSFAMACRTLSIKISLFLKVLWAGLLFISLLLFQIEEYYSSDAIVTRIPLLILFITGFGVGSITQLSSAASRNDKKAAVVYGLINFLFILVFIEDFIVSFFDNFILHPYVFLLVNLFFIWFFGIELRKSAPGITPNVNFKETINRFEISHRELDVLKLLLTGEDRCSIGEKLFISPNTVKTHISNIYKKLEISSRQELFALFNMEEI